MRRPDDILFRIYNLNLKMNPYMDMGENIRTTFLSKMVEDRLISEEELEVQILDYFANSYEGEADEKTRKNYRNMLIDYYFITSYPDEDVENYINLARKHAMIKELGKEKTVILSSHILSEVEATCDRILIINRGRIVADGTAQTLRQQAQGQEVLTVQIESSNGADVNKELLGLASVEKASPVEGKDGFYSIQSKPETSSRKPIFDLCVKNKWYLLEMTGTETNLEDVFRKLTN